MNSTSTASPATPARLSELAERGLTVQQIAEEFGIGKSTALYHLRRYGIDTRGQRRQRKAGRTAAAQRAVEMRKAGESLSKIAKAVNASQSTVRYWINTNGEVKRETLDPPTPDEIRQRCLEVQKEWSEQEKASRAEGREVVACDFGRKHQVFMPE